ncbi:MAG: DMT family transporter [Chloroflexota bacterium]
MVRPSSVSVRPQTAAQATLRQRGIVYAMLFFTVVAWGGSFVAARMVLSPADPRGAHLSPTLLATVRFALASTIFLPLLLRERRPGRPLRVSDLPLFLFLGQLSISIYFWLQYTGVQLTNSGLSAVLVVGLIPLATLLVSGIALREPIGRQRALALALGALGVVVVVSQKDLGLALESGFLFGALCLIANAACFAVYSTLVRGIRARYSSLTTTAGMTLSGTLGLVLLSATSEDWRTLGGLSVPQWLAIVFLAVVCSVIAYYFYNFALARMEASKTAVWLYLEPPVAMVLGAVLLGETVASQTVVGGLIIMGSLYLTQRS